MLWLESVIGTALWCWWQVPARRCQFQKWIKENEHLLKPPVGNKKVFEDGAMTVQVVGSP
jgi:3-hydroxyanthranilic acid dioxygenase